MFLEIDDDLLVLPLQDGGRLLRLQMHILEQFAQLQQFSVAFLVDLELESVSVSWDVVREMASLPDSRRHLPPPPGVRSVG